MSAAAQAGPACLLDKGRDAGRAAHEGPAAASVAEARAAETQAQAGATTFLAPTANCGELDGRVPEGLQVYAVDTLAQAREIVEAVGRGEPPESARTCG